MRFHYGRKFTVATESAAVQQDEEDLAAKQGDGTTGAETVETELLETQDLITEGEDRAAAIEEAEVVMDELEEDQEVLAEAQESGGMTTREAHILMRKVNNDLARIGIASARFPATESFGRASSRASSTRLAMESISEKLKQIWKAIIDAIKKSIRWVRDVYNKFFGTFEGLVKRAKAIQERADNTTGSLTSEHKKIENDRIFKLLAVNNSFDKNSVQDLLDKATEWLAKGFSEQNKFIERVVDKLGDIDEDAIVKLENESTSADDGAARNRTSQTNTILETTLGLRVDTLKDFLPDHGLDAKNVTGNLQKDFPDEGTEASKELPGNMCLVVTGGGIEKLRVRLVGYDTKRNIKEGKPINALSTGEVSTLAEAVEQFAEEGVRVRKDGDKLADNKEKLVKQAERLSKLDFDFKKHAYKADSEGKVTSGETDEDDTTNNKAGRDGSKTIRKAITNLNSFTGDFQVRYTGYAVNVAKTTLDLCELSLKAYDASKN